MLALEAAEGAAHVVGQSLILSKIIQLQGLLESCRSVVVVGGRLALGEVQTNQELALASIIWNFGRFLQTSRPGLSPEALQVIANECRTGESWRLVRKNFLRLLLGELLQQPLNRLGAALVLEPVDNAAGSIVEKSLAVFAQFVVGTGAAVEGFDVLGVELERGSTIFNNGFPVIQRVMTSGAV